jgi:prevent-host-death family protein
LAWQLQEAKQRFSEVVRRALDEGPQFVTRNGKSAVVVLDVVEYRRLKGVPTDFKAFLLTMPRIDDLEIERSKEPPREVDL